MVRKTARVIMADDENDLPDDFRVPPPGADPLISSAQETVDNPLPSQPDLPEEPDLAPLPLSSTEPLQSPRDGEILPPGRGVTLSYESRIRIVDAWQYPGNVISAPGWIDRDWIGFADWDPVRDIPAGPALRIPDDPENPATSYTICRVGDYVARQEILLTTSLPGEMRIEVWPKEQFQRLFIPNRPEAG
jgi:hypothetical protein